MTDTAASSSARTTELRRQKRLHRKVRAFIAAHPLPEPHDPLANAVAFLATTCDRSTTRQQDVTR